MWFIIGLGASIALSSSCGTCFGCAAAPEVPSDCSCCGRCLAPPAVAPLLLIGLRPPLAAAAKAFPLGVPFIGGASPRLLFLRGVSPRGVKLALRPPSARAAR